MMSGAPLPALIAVKSLVTAGSPPSCLFTVTWMSGFFAFHIATTLSTFGAQVQKVRSTFAPDAAAAAAVPAAGPAPAEVGPFELAADPVELPEQAVNKAS